MHELISAIGIFAASAGLCFVCFKLGERRTTRIVKEVTPPYTEREATAERLEKYSGVLTPHAKRLSKQLEAFNAYTAAIKAPFEKRGFKFPAFNQDMPLPHFHYPETDVELGQKVATSPEVRAYVHDVEKWFTSRPE